MSGESLGIGELGLAQRLASDSTLRDLVGVDEANEPRIYHGYPTELLEMDDPSAEAFPRITYFRPGSIRAAKGSGDLRIQVNIWVVPEPGAKATLEAIDSRILELVDEQWWTHDGVRLNGRAIGGEADTPATAPRPMSRRRDLWIGVN